MRTKLHAAFHALQPKPILLELELLVGNNAYSLGSVAPGTSESSASHWN